MMKTSKNQRNPGLFVPTTSYGIPYISPFYEFLMQNDYFRTDIKTTEKWRNYPIYLKETLFYFADKFKEVRKVEVGYKFFTADELKE